MLKTLYTVLLLALTTAMFGLPVVGQAMPEKLIHHHSQSVMVNADHSMAHCKHSMDMPDCPFCNEHHHCNQMQSTCGNVSPNAAIPSQVTAFFTTMTTTLLLPEKPMSIPFQRLTTPFRPPISA